MASSDFSSAVLAWFDQHGRKHLPWQQNITAYRVWLSEIMLQQTQVATVIPYFNTFTQTFPTVAALAAAPVDEVLHLWTGLGYYARARNLHACAKKVVTDFAGEFPQDQEALADLPGIGRSTAAAICSIVWNQPTAILDGNVKRVLARYHAVEGWPGATSIAKQLWDVAETLMPLQRCADYTQAMMDLGATVCTRSKPECPKCPLQDNCHALQQGNPQDYPGKKPKKILPVKSAQLLMIQQIDGSFLLEQRPPQGIWGGLWSFPETASDADALQACTDRWGGATLVANWPTYRHTFSHYHFDIQPVWLKLHKVPSQVMADNRLFWYNPEQPANLGLAAPIKKLLGQLQQSLNAEALSG